MGHQGSVFAMKMKEIRTICLFSRCKKEGVQVRCPEMSCHFFLLVEELSFSVNLDRRAISATPPLLRH